jgi:hypothetical protein
MLPDFVIVSGKIGPSGIDPGGFIDDMDSRIRFSKTLLFQQLLPWPFS